MEESVKDKEKEESVRDEEREESVRDEEMEESVNDKEKEESVRDEEKEESVRDEEIEEFVKDKGKEESVEDKEKEESVRDEEKEDFIRNSEEEKFTEDAENQTYLQGVPVVEIQVEYRDEASQTMYMGAPCPPLKYFKDIMTSMNEVPMPSLKESKMVGTILSFHPETSQNAVTEKLSTNVTNEELEEFAAQLTEEEETETVATDNLNFVLQRVFWISDPSAQVEVERNDEETQTSVRFNFRIRTVVLDSETQTGLTCEPRQSNTKLLSDYQEIKSLALSCLEDCISRGVVPRIIVDDVIEEIVDKCAELVKSPTIDQTAQTITSYKSGDEKEEDVLRKLKLDVVVDPSEGTFTVGPLIDDLLENVYEDVCKCAPVVVRCILENILQRTTNILVKLEEIRKESEPKPMDQIFDRRKRKILGSMLKKQTETISTQTDIAGVPEITRTKEPREVVCSVCRRHSTCYWCSANQENENVEPQETLMRTQDILLAYTPCYVVATPSENEKNPNLRTSCPPEEFIKQLPTPPVYISETSTEASSETINVLLKPERRPKAEDSVSGWSRIIDTALAKPWSTRGSVGSASKTATGSSERSTLKVSSKRSLGSENGVPSQAAQALEILKSTFCTQETCVGPSQRHPKRDFQSDDGDSARIETACGVCSMSSNDTIDGPFNRSHCAQQTCKVLPRVCPLERHECLEKSQCTESINSQDLVRSEDDTLKIIPICPSYSSDSWRC